MKLVDTSTWINHLRANDVHLSLALTNGDVVTHPFVIGELACGTLQRREHFLARLHRLVQLPIAGEEDVMDVLRRSRLWGHGLGWVDLHLLTAAAHAGAALWTADRALARAASAMGLSVVR